MARVLVSGPFPRYAEVGSFAFYKAERGVHS